MSHRILGRRSEFAFTSSNAFAAEKKIEWLWKAWLASSKRDRLKKEIDDEILGELLDRVVAYVRGLKR